MSYSINRAIFYFSPNDNWDINYDNKVDMVVSGNFGWYAREATALIQNFETSAEGKITLTSNKDLFSDSGEDAYQSLKPIDDYLDPNLVKEINQKTLSLKSGETVKVKLFLIIYKDGVLDSAYCFIDDKGFAQIRDGKIIKRFPSSNYFVLDKKAGPFTTRDPNLVKKFISKLLQKVGGIEEPTADEIAAKSQEMSEEGVEFLGKVFKGAANTAQALLLPGEDLIVPLYRDDGTPIEDKRAGGLTWMFKQCLVDFFGGNPDLEKKGNTNYQLNSSAPGYAAWKNKHPQENYIIGKLDNTYDYRTIKIVRQFKDEINKYNKEHSVSDPRTFITIEKGNRPAVYSSFLQSPACNWDTAPTSAKKQIDLRSFIKNTPAYQAMEDEKDALNTKIVQDAFTRIYNQMIIYIKDYNSGKMPKDIFIKQLDWEINRLNQYPISDKDRPFFDKASKFLNFMKTKVNSTLQESRKIEQTNKIYKDYSFIEYKNKKLHSILMESLKKDIKEDK